MVLARPRFIFIRACKITLKYALVSPRSIVGFANESAPRYIGLAVFSDFLFYICVKAIVGYVKRI